MKAGDVLDLAFERICVVNLSKRKDRRREMCLHLDAIGLNLSRVDFFSAIRPTDRGAWPSIGARGCFLSQLQVLREAAKDGVESVLLLEDDCEMSSAFQAHPDEVWDVLKGCDWQYLHGGQIIRERQTLAPRIRSLDPKTELVGAHFVAFKGEGLGLAVSYLEEMLERPAGSPDGGPMHVDGAYSWFRRAYPDMNSFTFVPSLAFQRASSSNIAEVKWHDSVPVIRDAAALARRVKNRIKR